MSGHKTIVIPDSALDSWQRAKVSLSRLWRRDAEAVRRRAMQVERRAKIAVSNGWHRLGPRVVQVEHRMHDGLLAALHRLRPHA